MKLPKIISQEEKEWELWGIVVILISIIELIALFGQNYFTMILGIFPMITLIIFANIKENKDFDDYWIEHKI